MTILRSTILLINMHKMQQLGPKLMMKPKWLPGNAFTVTTIVQIFDTDWETVHVQMT